MESGLRIDMNGLCRFSYPFAPGAFGGRHATLDDTRAQLYAAPRLTERLFIFRHIFLPPLIAQTDRDFTVTVLIGDQMPAPFKDQIIAMTRDVPAIRLVIAPEGQDPKLLCDSLFKQMRTKTADLVGEFRLDDDDAIAVDFIATARAAGQEFGAPILKRGLAGVDFSSGAFLYFAPDQIDVTRIVFPHLSCGQVIFQRPKSSKSAIKYHHYRMWRKNLYINMPDAVMYLRSVHGFNASGVNQTIKTKDVVKLTDQQTATMMQTRFDIDLAQLRHLWRDLQP